MTLAPVVAREARGQRAIGSSSEAPAATATATATAAASVAAGIGDWWAARAAAAGLSGPWLDVETAVEAQPPDLPHPADSVPELLGTAEQIGQLYVSALPAGERSRHGRHYTPQLLADELWSMAKRAMGQQRLEPLDGLVLDPACGAGALLLPVLREHLRAVGLVEAQLVLNALPNHIAGIDTDPIAVWLANVLLASEMLPLLSRTERTRRKPLPALVRRGDGLQPVDRPVRVVIMNPPYGRVRLGDDERTRFSEWVYGHANLYGLFMGSAVDSLDDQGVLAALVPTSYLAGRYFENLRATLVERAPLREIGFVSDRNGTFSGVLQETSLATFARERVERIRVNRIEHRVSEVASVASPRVSTPWLLPRRREDAAAAAAAVAMPLKLADAGWRVSTGPLVWNRRKPDLGSRSAVDTARVLWAADIDGGVVHRDRARDAVRFLTLSGSDQRVMLLSEPAVLVQRTTAPEQARRLVSAYLDRETLGRWGGRVVVENHVNVVCPLTDSPLMSAETLTRLFASTAMDRVLRCLSGSVAVSAYELESLPLPSADVLAVWSTLAGDDFDRQVELAYGTVAE